MTTVHAVPSPATTGFRPVAAVLSAALNVPGLDVPTLLADAGRPAPDADLAPAGGPTVPAGPGARPGGVGAPDDAADGPGWPPERAAELLGRKGLLAKEPATRLALCAVHRALGLPPKAPRRTGPADPRTAVVVSSNLGNVATVGDIAGRLRDGGPREVGPLEAPNASSNVIAGAIAIWFRFGGPNLTVCSGATAGLDAIWLAGLLLRVGRADRVVVVGVEPDDPQARALHAARRGATPGRPLRAGAACLLLGPPDTPERPLPPRDPADAAGRPPASLDPTGTPERPLALLGPVRDGASDTDPLVDEARLDADHYGAAGVVHTALAVRLTAGTPAVAVRCGDPVDGVRETTVRAVPR
ncbi:beta-ketoacyl synthase N-terminal-like domain-containing protein [Micromonospora sp. WMMC241]|uniref:beta-ketoacyl synthase N-terminal-like domain-containing protein n=1 Tax=Micromonospora sp. WMMC241 TaxID=3015159 RepID=UPI0022B6888A|nr:beta-ketoacyl synthase N-terminal-like domain-containing protein [Micromonospora sp. WMMC241]MCZ7437548.1 beta-ketoacyl synthase N-terminal-like domain-containing protein [Micromonospora sp. WMMC241]